MAKWGPDDVMKLTKQVEILRDTAAQDKDAVARLYPSFNPEKDARIAVFGKLINVMNSVQLGLTFVSNYLLRRDWWQSISGEMIPMSDIAVYAREFEGFMKIGFVQFMFSSVESSLRVFLRALDPIACRGGTGGFKGVYDCLFKSKLSVCPHEGIEVLDLLRNARNTIHNNGVYFDRNGNDATVCWRGVSYTFTHAQPVDFVTWEFTLEVADAVRGLIRAVVEDPSLRAITTEITDPSSP